MQASSSSSNSGHSSTDMYYTRTLFGHPLFAPAVLLGRDATPTPSSSAAVPSADTSMPVADFIDLDVVSDFAAVVNREDAVSPAAVRDQSAIDFRQDFPITTNANPIPFSLSPSPTVNASPPGLHRQPAIANNLIASIDSSASRYPLPTAHICEAYQNDVSHAPNGLFISSTTLDVTPAENSVTMPFSSSSSSFASTSASVLQPPSTFGCSAFSNQSIRDVFIMKESDLAPGNSMTCSIVNLLRGCNLLDSCTLEDLCDYLPALRRKHPALFLPSQMTSPPTSTNNSAINRRQPKRRSLSCCSPSSPSPGSLSCDKEEGKELLWSDEAVARGGDLVDYLLTCSRLGSTTLADFLSPAGSAVSTPELPLDWRRGRSDGMVCLVTTSPTLGPLLSGRFVPQGSAGCSFAQSPADLMRWLAHQLTVGAVVMVALLNRSSGISSSPPLSCHANAGGLLGCGATNRCCELLWRHRMVFGVSGNGLIHLSNPVETVTAESLLVELSRETRLCVPKREMMGRLCKTDQQIPDQDVSLLARQSDPRWRRFNILGQVISTLRDFDSTMRVLTLDHNNHQNHHNYSSVTVQEHINREPHLVIPCSQRPGFSVFLPRTTQKSTNPSRKLNPTTCT